LAEASPARLNPTDNLLPPLTEISHVSYLVALATAKEAVNAGLAEPMSDAALAECVKAKMWTPRYLPYKQADFKDD